MNKVIHFEIAADDTDRIGAFYRDVFGWNIVMPPSPEVGESYLLAVAGAEDEPGISGAIMQHHPREQRVVNTIEVASLSETIARIESTGGTVVQGPEDIPGVGRHCYCMDPEGIRFGVLEPMAGASEFAAL